MFWRKKTKEVTVRLIQCGKFYRVTAGGLPCPDSLTMSLEEAQAYFDHMVNQLKGKTPTPIIIEQVTITVVK